METPSIVTLPKIQSAEQKIVREFAPYDDSDRSRGKLIIRADNYGSSLAKFDQLYGLMHEDALTFEPPLQLDRDSVEVVHYAGERYAHTFGLEVAIPEGHQVADSYTRISQIEKTL